jgi:hypothetical protein
MMNECRRQIQTVMNTTQETPAALRNFAKLGEPSPVIWEVREFAPQAREHYVRLTGSQPAVGEKPLVPHAALPEPVVMSFKAFAAVEYSQGFKNPSGDLPA